MKTVQCLEFGGKADGEYDNGDAFRAALEALRDSGGGILDVGRGVWRTGPLDIYSNTIVRLAEGSVLSFIPDPELYRPVPVRWEGVECHAMHPCIFSTGQHDVGITGTGTVDANGAVWWDILRRKRASLQTCPETPIERELAGLNPAYRSQGGGGGGREIQFLRPSFIQFFECRNVVIEGITIIDSPFWTVHPVYCDGLSISGITIRNPHDAPNTDGIDIDSCRNVTVANCDISVGDDGIALKSGSGADGVRVNRSTSGVVVRNCLVGDGHGGIVIGSETAGGIHDVLVEDCVFKGTDRGIRIKTRRGRGGDISGLVFRNLVMERNLCPLSVNMYYRCGADPSDPVLFSLGEEAVTAVTPRIHGISISGIRATGCRASAGFIVGLPEHPVTNLVLDDCVFETDEASPARPDESDMFSGLPPVTGKGIRIRNALDPVFSNVTVTGPADPFIRG